jgi:hypothetical protein
VHLKAVHLTDDRAARFSIELDPVPVRIRDDPTPEDEVAFSYVRL